MLGTHISLNSLGNKTLLRFAIARLHDAKGAGRAGRHANSRRLDSDFDNSFGCCCLAGSWNCGAARDGPWLSNFASDTIVDLASLVFISLYTLLMAFFIQIMSLPNSLLLIDATTCGD